MNIREKIGQRIEARRKSLGYTRKALAELTLDLKPTRINNWERGTRLPGPEEIKQLAKVLRVSPAYLMCLTDEVGAEHLDPAINIWIPLLDNKQNEPLEKIQIIKAKLDSGLPKIPIPYELAARAVQGAFALEMMDDSMEPELKRHDILITAVDMEPHPGNLVVAKLPESNDIVIRKYRQVAISKQRQEIELLAINQNWAKIIIDNPDEIFIIGCVLGIIRQL